MKERTGDTSPGTEHDSTGNRAYNRFDLRQGGWIIEVELRF